MADTGAAQPIWRLLLAIAVVFAVLLLKDAVLAPPDLRDHNVPGQFNAARAFDRLAEILRDDAPHPVDSRANDVVRERLMAVIRRLGFEPEVRDEVSCRSSKERGFVTCARVRNVLFTVPDENGSLDDAVMVSAHYDSVPAAVGANDDGLGVAVMLELAHLLDRPPPRPVVFLFTDGEEIGLLGASSFVANDPLAGSIAEVINIEARGALGPVFMFETGEPNANDVMDFLRHAHHPVANSAMTSVYKRMPNDTDLSVFLERGYAGLNYAISGRVDVYHSARDNLASVDLPSLQHMGDLTLTALRNKLFAEEVEARTLLFSDVAATGVVRLPVWMGWMVIALGLVASAMRMPPMPALARSAWVPLAALAGAVVLSVGVLLVVDAVRWEQRWWQAQPLPAQLLTVCCALLPMLALASWLSGEERSTAELHGSWFWFAALGLGLGVVATGTLIVFVLPILGYVTAVVVERFKPGAGLLLHGIAAGFLMLFIAQIVLQVEYLGGYGLMPVLALLIALAAMPLIFLVALSGGRVRAAVVGLVVAVAFVTFAATLSVPGYSKERPGLLNLAHVTSPSGSHWLTQMRHNDAPPAFQDAGFLPSTVDGWVDEVQLEAPALPEALPATDAHRQGGHIELTLPELPDGTTRLRFPAEAKVLAFEFNGQMFEMSGEQPAVFLCRGRACSGRKLLVHVASTEPIEFSIERARYGLPDGADEVIALRGDSLVPFQGGDKTLLIEQLKIP